MTRAAVWLPWATRPAPKGAVCGTAGAPEHSLSRRSDTTLAEQLTQRYAELIRQRLLGPGARLPSVRECARRHEVSPATVVSAYDQLLARGLVEARPHRGFFVRGAAEDAQASRGAARPAKTAATRHPVPNSA